MTERTPVGWRVPEDVWADFETFVAERHGATDAYVRFELECAMREFLDEDDLLAEAEDLLRTHTDLKGLSSSTVAGIGTDRYRGADTKKVNHRISSSLHEQFRIFADEHDADSYGRLLASALDAYTDGGRAQRILDDVERLVTNSDGGTSSDTTNAAVENPADEQSSRDTTSATVESGLSTPADSGISSDTDPENVDIKARLVLGIVEELPDADALANTVLPKSVLDDAITEVVGSTDPTVLEAYREPVLEQLDAAPHPHIEDRYVTAAWRENRTVWADMDKAERIVLLRRYAADDAVDRRQLRLCFTYREVQALFEENACGGRPSHQYAYDLMEAAADEDGFEFDEFHGQKQLRVTLDEVSDSVLEYAFAHIELSPEDLGMNGRLEDYGAGSPPAREGVGDD